MNDSTKEAMNTEWVERFNRHTTNAQEGTEK